MTFLVINMEKIQFCFQLWKWSGVQGKVEVGRIS